MTDYFLADELLAISSIYGPDVLVAETQSLSADSSYVLHVPNSDGVSLRLCFPASYPATSPPTAIAVVSSGTHAAQGRGTRVLALAQAAISRAFVPGEPVMFEMLEALGEALDDGHDADGHESRAEEGDDPVSEQQGKTVSDDVHTQVSIEWVASDVVTEKKSAFVAHACHVDSAAEATANVALLVASDRKFERATHNISACRGRFVVGAADGAANGRRELVFQDCDDDGEDAAGGRLLHLLELTGAENVLVVVSRWYGGVKLGPDRFRIINQVAREALVRGGWVKEGGAGGRQAAKKGK